MKCGIWIAGIGIVLALVADARAADSGCPYMMTGSGTCRPVVIPSNAPDRDRSWHLLTQSYGGTVSLLKDLTKHECEEAQKVIKVAVIKYWMPPVQSGDIKIAECFQ